MSIPVDRRRSATALAVLALAFAAPRTLGAEDAPGAQRTAAEKRLVAGPVEPAELGGVEPVHLVDGMYLAGQPSRKDFAKAKARGVKTVIDVRLPTEAPDRDEQAVVTALGLTYVNVPIGGVDDLTDETFDRMRELLRTAERPLLVHCVAASRVAAAWVPFRVLDSGVPLAIALEEAHAIGLTSSELEEKARAYVEARQRAERK